MNSQREQALKFLVESEASHQSIAHAMMAREFEPMKKFYAIAVIKRSFSLVFGFVELVRKNYFLCAVPLIRLQVDNLLRFRAASLVRDELQFIRDVLDGKPISQLKDRFGNRLTDVHLQTLLTPDYPWLKSIYQHTSGFIHLSDKHLLDVMRVHEVKGGTAIYFGPDDALITDDEALSVIETMIQVTHELLSHLAGYVESHGIGDNPRQP